MKQKLDAALDDALKDGAIVGGVLMVSEKGETVYARAVGCADRETATPMTLDARFRLASVTKPIMTAVFMSLVEEGMLDLFAPITDHLPGFRPRLPGGEAPEITLHHLLTHSSGLGYRFLESETGPYARENISDGLDQPGLSLEENLSRIAAAPLYFAPGAGWRYSVGLDVAGAAAEAATGESLQTLLDRRVSEKLGLSSLRFHVAPEEDDLVTPYRDAPGEPALLVDGYRQPLWDEGGVSFAPSRVYDPRSFPSCGAGLVGSAPEVLAVLRHLQEGGAPLLKSGTVAEMMRNQLAPGVHTMHGPGWGFGYGWGVLTDPALAQIGEPKGIVKWGGVYGHSWFMDPEKRIVLLLTNTAYEGMSGQLPARIADIFYA